MTRPTRRAFTLLELLVVIAIIGILMTVALPRLKGFGQSNGMIAATRQLLDDIALARDTAMASRSEVYMVFVPAFGQWIYQDGNPMDLTQYSPTELATITNLLAGQYSTYAIYSARSVGDQPGQSNPRYLTPWRTMPSGTFLATNTFNYSLVLGYTNGVLEGVAPLTNNIAFRFPTATNSTSYGSLMLPYIAFNYDGSLANGQDVVLALARGSIFYPLTNNGVLVAPFTPDVEETPPNNSVTLYNHVRIDWLTGRAHVEREQLQ